MGFVKKEELPSFALEEEIVTVEQLGGDVIVRSPNLAERMQLSAANVGDLKPFAHMMRLLEVSVLDGDHKQLMTAAQWEVFGGIHREEALRLWDIAFRLADFDGERAAKNSKAPTSDSQ